MQSWQLVSFVFVAGVFALSFALRKRMRGKANSFFSGSMQQFRADIAQRRRPGESEPIAIVATERKMMSAKLFYIALTNQCFYVQLGGTETRVFDRNQVQLRFREKTFADVGNMTTTYSTGFELVWTLPDGEKHTCRVYAHAEGIPEHGAHVHALQQQLAA